MVVWWGSVVECASAIARLHREGVLTADGERVARETLDTLRQGWHEVQPDEGIREQALRVLRLHHLRAADALQLAAALEWSGTPASGVFQSLDDRLNAAAWREGFSPPR
jgi:predicted nucleic acid-binding protein